MANLRVRRSLNVLQAEYNRGEIAELETLIRALRGIQAIPADQWNSFFVLGGYHGQPFRGKGDTSTTWWGGYCNHNNILFPTWHRAYCLRLEEALRSIPGCENVTLPFWDETFDINIEPRARYQGGQSGDPKGPLAPGPVLPNYVPEILTTPRIQLSDDPAPGPNPLYSYSLSEAIKYQATNDNRYTKPAGYNTVRYPLSGLVGTEEAEQESSIHNAQFDQAQQTQILNSNVGAWLTTGVVIPDVPPDTHTPSDTTSVYARFLNCLKAPNYTVFSNNASQNEWNKRPGQTELVMSLESPHNAIHLAVGGFFQDGNYLANPTVRNANGDMGANEMAGFDPIFFLHHCFIDYTFWQWQKRHGLTQNGSLTIDSSITDGTTIITTDAGYPLAEDVSADNTPVIPLTLDTPLYPFKDPNDNYYTSATVTDIEQLGYTFGVGSLDKKLETLPAQRSWMPLLGENEGADRRVVLKKLISGINRANYVGSFVIRTYALLPSGKEVEVGREPILSRWQVQGCKNCDNKLNAESVVAIDKVTLDLLREGNANYNPEFRIGVQQIHRELRTTYPSRRGLRDGEGWEDLVGRDGPPEPTIGDLE